MHERHDSPPPYDRQHDLWSRASALARSILGRWNDPLTRAERDDIAQEAVMALWCYSRGRGELPVRPLLWTISRRARGRLLREAARSGIARSGAGRVVVVRGAALRSDALQFSVRDGGGAAAWRDGGADAAGGDRRDGAGVGGALAWDCGVEEPCLRVDGTLVPREWLMPRLLTQLARLSATNRRIVLAYYSGSTCLELGTHLGLSEEAVKVRLHRSRIVLRKRLEAMARAAGHFER